MHSDAIAPSPGDPVIAACRLVEALTALESRGKNLVTALVGEDAFIEQQHYPENEVFDPVSFAQFFLHAHRGHGESAHIHCFLRADALRGRHQPRFSFANEAHGMTHVAAVALDFNGRPCGLFTTNLWVTEDDWYCAEALIDCLDRLRWDHVSEFHAVASALTSLFALYLPVIRDLLRRRDKRLYDINGMPYTPRELTDERFDILSHAKIDLEKTLKDMRNDIAAHTAA